MKQAIPWVGLAILIVITMAGYLNEKSSFEVTNSRTATSTPITTVSEYPSEWLESAQEAFDGVIRKKELEAEETRLKSEIEALEASLADVQKELGTY